MNSELDKVYTEWEEEVLLPFLNKKECKNKYSLPFYIGKPSQYNKNQKTIMIIGQETNNFGKYNKEWSRNRIQKWCGDYIDRQVFGIDNGLKYNTSPFWKFFREFHKYNYNLIWNNLDKIHRYENNQTEELTEKEEKILNRRYGEVNKSLLEREIDIFNPDIIIFLTGPRFILSMATSFGVQQSTLSSIKPTINKVCSEISGILGINRPAFWTYHPGFLSRKKKFVECIHYIQNSINIRN
ncbi:MAG: hypothetical protein FH751_12645 [Firmicutes bacterium]|nr:hypothetical protein [Bacillota bacterium]